MRHHGRAEDPDREEDALRALEARDEPAGDRSRIGVGEEHLEREGDDDHPDERGDDRLETPETACLKRENPEGGDARDERGREQRDAEEQVDRRSPRR